MDHALYLRGRADEFSKLAAKTTEPLAAQHFQELAMMCRESADRLERLSGARILPSLLTLTEEPRRA